MRNALVAFVIDDIYLHIFVIYIYLYIYRYIIYIYIYIDIFDFLSLHGCLSL